MQAELDGAQHLAGMDTSASDNSVSHSNNNEVFYPACNTFYKVNTIFVYTSTLSSM